MRTIGQDILDTAWKEIGVREEPAFSNTGPRILQFQRATGLAGTRWPWCAAFDTWCYEENGIFLKNSAGFASVWLLEQFARDAGFWEPERPGYSPPPGACVIFNFSHTGIVNKKAGGALHTVEGNTSGQGLTGSQSDGGGVFARVRPLSEVKGYVVLPAILRPSPKAKPAPAKPVKTRVVYDVLKGTKIDKRGLGLAGALARIRKLAGNLNPATLRPRRVPA